MLDQYCKKELLRVFKTPEAVFQACGKELINCNGLGKEKGLIKKNHYFIYLFQKALKFIDEMEEYMIEMKMEILI